MKLAKTIGELKEFGDTSRTTKEEMRNNLLAQIRDSKKRFPGIIGYERTVIPQLENAILSKHDIILLGLRGQAKTRICRQLVEFLDEYIPVIHGSELNESPFEPVSTRNIKLVQDAGDELEIDWLHREQRYQEKLATPDVSIADLIGDIDPIKAVREKLDLSDEEVIHWGIIPRTNRGLFAINELPDLQPRIQVALLNILEENDLQIRGFPIRIPLDMMLVFTANPEDYTNRGNIITPLKDRISSQINTHYPDSLDDGMKITQQEAWIERGNKVTIPNLIKEVIEQIAFEARENEYVDQSSGVSARLPISAYENLISNIERRAAINAEDDYFPRLCDIYAVIGSIVGKVEMVYEGELEGPTILAVNIIGEAVRRTFERHFPLPRKEATTPEEMVRNENIYEAITDYFSTGRQLELSDEMPLSMYKSRLDEVIGLKKLAQKLYNSLDERETYLIMEFILEGLHRMNMIAKESPDNKFIYSDMIENILRK